MRENISLLPHKMYNKLFEWLDANEFISESAIGFIG